MDPLYVFCHVPKTGGQYIEKHIVHSLDHKEYLEISPKILNLKETCSEQTYKIGIKKLLNKSNSRLKVIFGHTIPYGIHDYVRNREVRYFTFLRDPIERIISLYNYLRTLALLNKNDYGLENRLNSILFLNGRIPDFQDWYYNIFKKNNQDYGLDSTYDFFTHFGFFQKNYQMDQFLNSMYFIGMDSSFKEDSLFIFHLLQINKYFIRSNWSIKFYNDKENNNSINKIKRDLRDSYVLYSKAKIQNSNFKKLHPEFAKCVQQQKIRRFLTLPFTQTLYDWREYLHSGKKFKKTIILNYQKSNNN